jgi:hypothetical protein
MLFELFSQGSASFKDWQHQLYFKATTSLEDYDQLYFFDQFQKLTMKVP